MCIFSPKEVDNNIVAFKVFFKVGNKYCPIMSPDETLYELNIKYKARYVLQDRASMKYLPSFHAFSKLEHAILFLQQEGKTRERLNPRFAKHKLVICKVKLSGRCYKEVDIARYDKNDTCRFTVSGTIMKIIREVYVFD